MYPTECHRDKWRNDWKPAEPCAAGAPAGVEPSFPAGSFTPLKEISVPELLMLTTIQCNYTIAPFGVQMWSQTTALLKINHIQCVWVKCYSLGEENWIAHEVFYRIKSGVFLHFHENFYYNLACFFRSLRLLHVPCTHCLQALRLENRASYFI